MMDYWILQRSESNYIQDCSSCLKKVAWECQLSRHLVASAISIMYLLSPEGKSHERELPTPSSLEAYDRRRRDFSARSSGSVKISYQPKYNALLATSRGMTVSATGPRCEYRRSRVQKLAALIRKMHHTPILLQLPQRIGPDCLEPPQTLARGVNPRYPFRPA